MTKSPTGRKKCIIVLNGPSVDNIKTFIQNHSLKEYDIIAVNRWVNIFRLLKLPNPNFVVVGKNSLQYNRSLIYNLRNTTFYGITGFDSKNYRKLTFGNHTVYGETINFYGALWWSGIYAIQLALKMEYEEIQVFGFTCSNSPDYQDKAIRAPLPNSNYIKIRLFFKQLLEKGLLNKITFHENWFRHPLRDILQPNVFIASAVP